MPEENISTQVPQEFNQSVPPPVEDAVKDGPSVKPDLETSLMGLFKQNEPEVKDEKQNQTPHEKDVTEQKPVEVKATEEKGEIKKGAVKPGANPEDPRNTPYPKNLSEKGRDGWKVLKEQAGKWFDTAKQHQAEIDKLKAELANRGKITSQEVEKYRKQVEELAPFRTMVDIHSDPDRKSVV